MPTTNPAPGKPPSAILPVTVFGLASMVILAFAYWIFVAELERDTRDAEVSLAAVAALKARQVSAWRDEKMGDAQSLAGDRAFVGELHAWLRRGAPDDPSAQRIQSRLASVRDAYGYRTVMLLDATGRPRMTLGEAPPTGRLATAEAYLAAVPAARVAIVGPARESNAASPRQYIDIVAPLRAAGNTGEAAAGALVLRSDFGRAIADLVSAWPGDSPSAESLLIQRVNGRVAFLTAHRHRPDLPLDARLPLILDMLATGLATQDGATPREGAGHRGISTLFALHAVADSPWHVLVKVDRDEVLGSTTDRALQLAGVAGLIIVVTAAILLLWWQRRQKAVAATLASSERRFRTLTQNLDGMVYRCRNDRTLAMSALQASEARLKEAQARAHLGSWELDLETNRLHWTDEVYRIFEIDPRQFDASYEGFLAAVHPDDRANLDKAYRDSVANRAPYSMEHRLLLPDGRVKWVWETGSTDYDATGKPLRSVGTVQDISERRRAEERLRASEQRLSFHLEHTPIAAIEWSLNFTVVSWNPAAAEIFGFSRDEAMGRHAAFILTPFARADVDRIWASLLAGTGGRRSTNENVRKDGEVILCDWFNTTLVDSQGTIVGVASLAQDITARRRVQDALENALARVRSLSERTVAIQEEERRMIAHELHDEIGQGLTAAKIHLQAMEQSCRDCAMPFLQGNLHEALSAVAHTLEQVRSLSLDLRPMHLDDLGLAVSLRALLDRDASAAGWVAHHDLAPGLGRLASSLELACYRVAQEALTNIMRHAEASEVWVRLRCDDQVLELTIRDDGVGFDVDSVVTGRGMASLGLFGMEERARSMGGQIEIQSTPGHGTEIKACFPMTPAATRDLQ